VDWSIGSLWNWSLEGVRRLGPGVSVFGVPMISSILPAYQGTKLEEISCESPCITHPRSGRGGGGGGGGGGVLLIGVGGKENHLFF